MAPAPHEITELLRAWSAGDKSALDKLMPLVYEDLRRVARKHMALEREGHSLQATALVHETYVRLVDSSQATLKDRAHFFAVCARLMRQILVDSARSRGAIKRGGEVTVVGLSESAVGTAAPAVDLIDLDQALNALNAFDARKSSIVEMRVFGGLSAEETAVVLNISTDTVSRDMHLAIGWLRREMGRSGLHGG